MINTPYKIVSILLVLLAVTGCQSATDITEPESTFSTSQQILGFAALSAAEELQHDTVQRQAEDTDATRENIDSKLYIANTFLGDTADFRVEVENSSLQGYQHTMTIEYVDTNKNTNTHEFHYNETILEAEDDEIESKISGIIIVNGVEYALTGTKEEEEQEYEYDLVAFIDDENYLTITYEVERESANEIEKEFKYERFEDKQLIYRMEIEFELEEDEEEITIKHLDRDFESEYSFTREFDDGREETKVEYKTSQAGVVIDEGEYSYNE